MARSKGFTLIEILVVIIILGILAIVALPNVFISMEQTKANAAQNNLLAITAAQEKFYEDHNPNYCIGGCSNASGINQNLSLSIPGSDPFSYTCTGGSSFECGATDNDVALNATVSGVTCCTWHAGVCNPGGNACPST